MDASINRDELDRRIAVVRRFKELLGRQQERFRSYLAMLESQETAVGSGSGEEIMAHAELEGQILADIFSMQRVINPLEDMYRAMAVQGCADGEIPGLKISLEDMKARAQAQAAKNRELLRARMEGVRAEISTLRDSPFAKNMRSVYGSAAAPSFVNLRG